jgi:hypothetical protein
VHRGDEESNDLNSSEDEVYLTADGGSSSMHRFKRLYSKLIESINIIIDQHLADKCLYHVSS